MHRRRSAHYLGRIALFLVLAIPLCADPVTIHVTYTTKGGTGGITFSNDVFTVKDDVTKISSNGTAGNNYLLKALDPYTITSPTGHSFSVKDGNSKTAYFTIDTKGNISSDKAKSSTLKNIKLTKSDGVTYDTVTFPPLPSTNP